MHRGYGMIEVLVEGVGGTKPSKRVCVVSEEKRRSRKKRTTRL